MSSQISNIPSVQAKFSKGEDEDKMKAELAALLENGWKLDPKQAGLEKTFYLKTYTKVLVRYIFHQRDPADGPGSPPNDWRRK